MAQSLAAASSSHAARGKMVKTWTGPIKAAQPVRRDEANESPEDEALSRFLCRALRHDAAKLGLCMRKDGYVPSTRMGHIYNNVVAQELSGLRAHSSNTEVP